MDDMIISRAEAKKIGKIFFSFFHPEQFFLDKLRARVYNNVK